jgi:hypothetical protein
MRHQRLLAILRKATAMGKKIPTKEAAEFLTALGKPTEKTTLDTKRNTGGGPPFYKEDGKKYVLYDTDDLEEWAKSNPMRKYNSTSEYPPALRLRRKKTDNSKKTPDDKPAEAAE